MSGSSHCDSVLMILTRFLQRILFHNKIGARISVVLVLVLVLEWNFIMPLSTLLIGALKLECSLEKLPATYQLPKKWEIRNDMKIVWILHYIVRPHDSWKALVRKSNTLSVVMFTTQNYKLLNWNYVLASQILIRSPNHTPFATNWLTIQSL